MTNPQTVARAIKDAKLAAVKENLGSLLIERSKIIKQQIERAERAEAQLAEKNTALDEAVEIVRRHVPNIPHDGPTTTVQQAAYEAVGLVLQEIEIHARRAREQGGNGDGL